MARVGVRVCYMAGRRPVEGRWGWWLVVTVTLMYVWVWGAQGFTPVMDEETLARYETLLQSKTCKSWLEDPPEDCLKSHNGACVAAGCKWVAGYPGPWCQFNVPEHCVPTTWDVASKYIVAELGNITSLQWTAAFIAIAFVVVSMVMMVWADRRQALLERLLVRQEVKDEDDHHHHHHHHDEVDREESVVGTKYAMTPPSTSSSTPSTLMVPPLPSSSLMGTSGGGVRRRKPETNPDDVEDGGKSMAPSPGRGGARAAIAAGERLLRLPWFLRTDAVCCGVLFLLSMIIHVWRLEEPAILTYDECHFGYFVSKYFKREYLFDIHPPLAKMTFYALGSLLGHDPGPGAEFQFKGQMGTPYHNFNQFYPLRFIASFFGALVVPVMYLSCRALKISPSTSIVGASLVLWETCLLAESRSILTDSQLVFWNALTIFAMLKLFNTPQDNTASLHRWMIATAVCCGCVFGVKFTALATLGLIAVEAFFGFFLLKKPLTLAQCLMSGVVGLCVWMFWWWCHFAILIYDHSEVNWQEPDFQSSLIGNEWYGKLTPPWFPIKAFQLVITMIQVNAKTLDPHNWSSQWYDWVIGRGTRVLSAHESGWEVSILTNPAVIIITCCALAVGALLVFLFLRYQVETTGMLGVTAKSPRNRQLCCLVAFCLFGWLLNLLPYIFIARTTFVYHYLPGLLYAQLLTAVLCERLFQHTSYNLRFIVCFLLVSFMAFGWWYYAPWVYAMPLNDMQHEGRKLLLGK